VSKAITPSPAVGGYHGNPVSLAVNVVLGDEVVTEGTDPTMLIDVPEFPWNP